MKIVGNTHSMPLCIYIAFAYFVILFLSSFYVALVKLAMTEFCQ